MVIHDGFDIIVKCGDRRLTVHVLTKKRFLYVNELINDQNDYNVNKQIFIFLFPTCKIYIGTTSKINIYIGYLKRGRGGDVTKHKGFQVPVNNASDISVRDTTDKCYIITLKRNIHIFSLKRVG